MGKLEVVAGRGRQEARPTTRVLNRLLERDVLIHKLLIDHTTQMLWVTMLLPIEH